MSASESVSSNQFGKVSKSPIKYFKNSSWRGSTSYVATQDGKAIAKLSTYHKPEKLTMTVSNLPRNVDLTDDELADPNSLTRIHENLLSDPTHQIADIDFSIQAIDELNNMGRRNRDNTDKKIPVSESGLVQTGSALNKHYTRRDPIDVAEPGEQLQMFFYEPARRHTVDNFYTRSDMGSRSAGMIALSMADMGSLGDSGHHLLPSRNLSPHSLGLVEHLNDLGLVDDAWVPNESSNSIDFDHANHVLNKVDKDEISQHVDVTKNVPAAKRHLSNLLRVARSNRNAEKKNKQHNNEQPHVQLSLFSTQFNPKEKEDLSFW